MKKPKVKEPTCIIWMPKGSESKEMLDLDIKYDNRFEVMKREYKLIMLDTPIIVSDEVPNEHTGYWVYLGYDEPIVATKSCLPPNWFSKLHDVDKYKKVIAGLADLPSIDFNGLEEEFGIVNTQKLATACSLMFSQRNLDGGNDADSIEFGFITGFKTAQSLNDKKFSLEEMREAIAESWNSCEDNEDNETFTQCFNRIISQRTEPKIYNIEIEELGDSIKIRKVCQ